MSDLSAKPAAILHILALAVAAMGPFSASAAVPAYRGGWVHDGIYADKPLEGAKPVKYKQILHTETIPDIQWAVRNGMRQLTLNVGIDYLLEDGIGSGGRYTATYRTGSLETMLRKVTVWNAEHAATPNLQVGVKLRIHGGTRQTKTVKDALGTIKVTDEGFNIQGTVPMHWKQTPDKKYPFRIMYQEQMRAIAQAIADFNARQGNAVQSVIVPGNAFFYPEPFTIMQNSRSSSPDEPRDALSLGTRTRVNPLLRRFGDGSDSMANRSYIVRNLDASNTITVTCNGKKMEPIAPHASVSCTSDPGSGGRNDELNASAYPTKFQISGATNKEKLIAAGLRGSEQVAYYRWLSGSAHDAFKKLPNVHVGIALNPYQSIDHSDATDRKCLTIAIGNAWVSKWREQAQLENYSYRSIFARNPAFHPRNGRAAAYDRMYDAMEHWAKMRNVIVGVQLARTPRVWLNWPNERFVWNQLLMDAVERGWSFVEPSGRAMKGHTMNAWPDAYRKLQDSDFKDGAVGLADNFSTAASDKYNASAPCK